MNELHISIACSVAFFTLLLFQNQTFNHEIRKPILIDVHFRKIIKSHSDPDPIIS